MGSAIRWVLPRPPQMIRSFIGKVLSAVIILGGAVLLLRNFNYYDIQLHNTQVTSVVKNHLERVNALRRRCERSSKEWEPAIEPQFYQIERAEFACCRSPETGSSSWGKIAEVIKDLSEHENTKPRVMKTNIRAMVARDPYYRLYATFIKEIFLFGELGRKLSKSLGKESKEHKQEVCGYDVNFEDYLKFAIDNSNSRELEDVGDHMLTLGNLCDPCNVHYDFILKRETLTHDTEHLLKVLHIQDSVRARIIDSLRSNTQISSMSTLITYYFKQHERFREDCPDIVEFSKKLWKALKVLGFIYVKEPFPRDLESKITKITLQDFLDYATKTCLSHPITHETVEFQHQGAVRYAYSKVSDDTIKKLQDSYHPDFILFGYDTTPPHKRQV